MAEAGDVVAATDLALAAGAVEDAERLLGAHETRLLQTASSGDLDRWLATVSERAPTLGARLGALRTRLSGWRPRRRRPRAAASARRPSGSGRRAQFTTVRALATIAAIAIFELGVDPALPEGLGRSGLITLAAIIATVPLLVANVLPDYVVMLFLTLALVVPGLVSPADILGGFAAPAWLMIFTLLAVGVAVARSGLMFRLVLLSLQRLPPRFVPQSVVLCLTGVVMTAGLSSGSADRARCRSRAGSPTPWDSRPEARAAAAVGLMTFFTFLEMGELFQTGTFTGLIVHDLLRGRQGPDHLVALVLHRAAAVRRHRCRDVPGAALPLQAAQDGAGQPGSGAAPAGAPRPSHESEIWSAAVLLLLIVGFATLPYHGIAPAWLSLISFLLLFARRARPVGLPGRRDARASHLRGVILSLGNVFTTLHIDAWLTSVVQTSMPAMVKNPYGFVLTIAIIAFVLHFFVPWMTASTIIALVAMPIAEALGFHPFIPVLVALIAGDHTIPYVNSGYAIVYFASEGELFTHEQARWPLVIESLLRPVALLLSVPVWQLMGLM